MFNKDWYNALILDNPKDATLVSGKEGYGHVNAGMNDMYPISLILQKPRRWITALRKSWEYSKMGIFNCVVKQK